MRWEGLEPSRLAARGPQPRLSANSSTSAGRSYYNRLTLIVKQSPLSTVLPQKGCYANI